MARKTLLPVSLSPRLLVSLSPCLPVSPSPCLPFSLSLLLLVSLSPCLPCSPQSCRAGELQYPLSIAVADSGAIFIADRKLPGIWRLHDNKLLAFFTGSNQLGTPLNAVRCVELDRDGRLLAGDSATRDIYRFDETGQPRPLTRRPTEDQTASSAVNSGQVGIPVDIAVNHSGDIFVADLEIGRVVKLVNDGRTDPQEIARISACRGLFIDSQDNLWVVSTTADQLHRISPNGDQEVIVPGLVFEFPHAVAVADNGTAYVCDGYAPAIWRVLPGLPPEKWVQGQPLINPVGLALYKDKLFIADPHAKAIFQIDAEGKLSKLEFGVQPPSPTR